MNNTPDVSEPLRSSALVRPHLDGDDLTNRLMCYRCRYSFPKPPVCYRSDKVTCPNCHEVDDYDQHKCAPTDPLRQPLGWPYDDPTVPYDC